MIHVYNLNLIIPDINSFKTELTLFNQDLERKKRPQRIPFESMTEEDDAVYIEIDDDDGYSELFLEGIITLPPLDNTFSVMGSTFIDKTPELIGLQFIVYLCEKYRGTIVAVFEKEGELYPLKVIDGNKISCRIVLQDTN